MVVHALPSLPPARADRLQIEKVLINLLRNSIEATTGSAPRGKGQIAIRFGAMGDLATISVEDNGPGLRDEFARRAFDAFFTTKPFGIGMGLTISRTLAEANGGKLWYEPRGGGGAIFHFTVPLAPERTRI